MQQLATFNSPAAHNAPAIFAVPLGKGSNEKDKEKEKEKEKDKGKEQEKKDSDKEKLHDQVKKGQEKHEKEKEKQKENQKKKKSEEKKSKKDSAGSGDEVKRSRFFKEAPKESEEMADFLEAIEKAKYLYYYIIFNLNHYYCYYYYFFYFIHNVACGNNVSNNIWDFKEGTYSNNLIILIINRFLQRSKKIRESEPKTKEHEDLMTAMAMSTSQLQSQAVCFD